MNYFPRSPPFLQPSTIFINSGDDAYEYRTKAKTKKDARVKCKGETKQKFKAETNSAGYSRLFFA